MNAKVKMAFEPVTILLPLEHLLPTRTLPRNLKQQIKYRRILASVREVGIIEPLVVYRQSNGAGGPGYILLDGHLRLEALRDLERIETLCLLSTDDEAYTYNHHVNRLSAIQEHFMLARALKNGVSEDRLAKALNADMRKIREKRDLLKGICEEAVILLRDKGISAKALRYYRLVRPLRQIEMAELMVACHNFTSSYARALHVATPNEHLTEPDKSKVEDGVSSSDIAKMENEMRALEKDFRLVEESYGTNMLNLVVTRNYLARLLDNARVIRFLNREYPELLSEFQRVTDAASLEG